MQYRYQGANCCRWCGISDETLSHVVNCGASGYTIDNIEEIIYGTDIHQMKEVAMRIEDFLEKVDV